MKKNYSFPLYVLIFFTVWTVRATWFYSDVDLSIPGETWRLVFSNLVKFVLWVLPALALLWWFDREDPLSVLGLKTKVNARDLLIVSAATLFYFVLIFSGEYFLSGRTLLPMLHASPSALLGQFAAVFFSPIVEEMLFRGFIQYKLEGRFTFWMSNLVQASLFTLVHFPNWIWNNGFGPAVINLAVGVFLFGLFAGWVRRKSNSIYPPIVVHILNNFLAAFVG